MTDENRTALPVEHVERLANYLVSCIDNRHGKPGGDDCPRCKSDRRELQRLDLEKFWNGERYVMRLRRTEP